MITYPNVKLNLGLQVIRKREDGYHDLETLFIPYSGLSDCLEVITGDDYSRTLAGLKERYGTLSQAVSEDGKPTGAQALNLLGLSEQVPMNAVYLTDGSARKLKIYDNRGIMFQHTAPKNLAFSNELAMLVTFALREVGADSVTEEMETVINTLLRQEPKEHIEKDMVLMPEWIGKIVRRAYEK